MPIDRFNIVKGIFVGTGRDYETEFHAHIPIEVVFSLSGQFDIGTYNRRYPGIQAAIVGSNVPHKFSCLESTCQLSFFDPTTDIGERIVKRYGLKHRDLVVFDAFGAERLKEEYSLSALYHEAYLPHPLSGRIDVRIRRCLNDIEMVSIHTPITVAGLAEKSFLSESRLAHLFREQLGISVHQYILWKRIETALMKWQEGYSFTECAYFAGFSDSSHFNRVVRKTFGIPPSFGRKE